MLPLMDENSFGDVYLYRLYFITLYWGPGLRKQAGIITKTHVRSVALRCLKKPPLCF